MSLEFDVGSEIMLSHRYQLSLLEFGLRRIFVVLLVLGQTVCDTGLKIVTRHFLQCIICNLRPEAERLQ